MNRTDRLLAIVLELQAKGWQRAEDLAATFEISKRTIYRDMLALMESGVPVVSSPGQGYSLDEGYFLPPLSFSSDEAVMLLLGADYMAQNFDAEYRRASASAASKIQAVLPEKRRIEVDDLRASMQFIALSPLDASVKPELLPQIRRAIFERKTIRMVYHTRYSGDTRGEVNRRDADPYGLIHVDKFWHLAAYCHLRKAMRYFRLDRIDGLQVLATTFTRPADYAPLHAFIEDRPIVVRALFSPAVTRWVQEEPSYYTVAEEDTADGLLMTFHVRHESLLLNWLLMWGQHVRVLEPDSLRQQIADEAAALLRHHQLPSQVPVVSQW